MTRTSNALVPSSRAEAAHAQPQLSAALGALEMQFLVLSSMSDAPGDS
jgi:hypothetical protein